MRIWNQRRNRIGGRWGDRRWKRKKRSFQSKRNIFSISDGNIIVSLPVVTDGVICTSKKYTLIP
jgi:hypothetical protein